MSLNVDAKGPIDNIPALSRSLLNLAEEFVFDHCVSDRYQMSHMPQQHTSCAKFREIICEMGP